MSLFSGCLDASKRLEKVVSMHSCRPTLEKAVARGAALEFLYLKRRREHHASTWWHR